MSDAALAALPADVTQSNALLRTLLEVSLTGILLLRPLYAGADEAGPIVDFAYVHLNPAAQHLLRLPECPAESFLTLFPTAQAAGIFGFYQAAFQSGDVERHQQNYQADGLDGYYWLVAQRQGPLLVVSFTDTNEQPRSAVEEALRASQAREQAARAEAERQQALLYRVFEHAPAIICILQGPEHVFQFANAPYQALMGGRPLVGRPFAEALPELAGQGILEPLNEVYRTGESFFASEWPARIDHDNTSPAELEQRYYNLVWQARRDLAGAVDGVLVFAFDVTPQVLARQQVERLNAELETRVLARTQEVQAARRLAEVQQQRLEQLFMQAPAAICILSGPELVYELVNPAYQQLFPGRALAGLPLLQALPELADQPVWHSLQQVYRTGTTHLELGIHIPVARHAGGPLEDFYFNYVQQARFDAQGQVDGAVVFAFDVTEQVRARQQVQDLNEELAAINEELTTANDELGDSNRQLTRTNVDLDTFVYTASHDLKAPITNIEGILAALRDTLPLPVQQDEVVAHLLGLLQTTVGRFLTTIDQLTDLSRLQRTYNEPAERLALAPVVAGVVEDLAPAITAAAAQVQIEVPAALHVSFAPASLRSIVYNLLSNAIKYRDPARPAQVWLTAEAQPGAVVLSVRDNGLGLSATQQTRLFGVFQRLHTHVEGTGVGLYMIKRLIENAGATIAVTSAPNVGSTFTVTFPA